MQFESYAPLLARVADAWRGVADAGDLRRELQQHRAALALRATQPDKAERERIQAARAVTVDGVRVDLSDTGGSGRRTLDFVFAVSDALHVHELDGVRLIWTAAQRAPHTSTQSLDAFIQSHTLQLHYQQRYNLLVTLLDLLLIDRQRGEFDDSIASTVHDTVTALYKDSLIENLLALVQSLVTRINASAAVSAGVSDSGRKMIVKELDHAIKVLLVIAQSRVLTDAQSMALLRLVQSTSAIIDQSPSQSQPQSMIVYANYALLTVWIASLECQCRSLSSSARTVSSFITTITAAGDSAHWRHIPSQALYMLSWALYLARAKKTFSLENVDSKSVDDTVFLALSLDVSVFVAVHQSFFTSVYYHSNSRNNDLAESWGDFINALYEHFNDHLIVMRDEERATDSNERNFDSLLTINAIVVRQCPNIGVMLLNNVRLDSILGFDLDDSTTTTVLQSPPALLESPSLYAHLDLLCALAKCGDGAVRVYQSLKPSSRELTWDILFRVLHRVSQVYGPASQSAINDRDSGLVCALLRLLTSVSLDAIIRQHIHNTQEYRALDQLFALLSCRLDIDCKAAVIDAVTALTKGDSVIASTVISKMLGANIVSGLSFDLREVESHQRRYPLTLSFARLVLTLASTLSAVSKDFHDYVNFLRSQVFLSLNDRQYASVTERWKLTETCLAVFDRSVRDTVTVPNIEAPGAELMRDLLSGREMLGRVLETVTRAYQTIEARQEDATVIDIDATADASTSAVPVLPSNVSVSALDVSDDPMSSVEGSLRFSLSLLALLSNNEDQCVSMIRAHDSRARIQSLSSLMIGHPQEVLVVAHTTAYTQGFPLSFAQRLVNELDAKHRADAKSRVLGQLIGVSDANVVVGDDTGIVSNDSAAVIARLVAVSDSRVAHLLEVAAMTVSVATALASLLRAIQADDEDAATHNLAHSARLALLRTINESVERHTGSERAFGLTVLGLPPDNDRERSVLLDTIIDLVTKPRLPIIAPKFVALCFELFARLLANGTTRPHFLAVTERREGLLVSLLASLPADHRGAVANKQRRWLLDALALSTVAAVETDNRALISAIAQSLGLSQSVMAPVIPALSIIEATHVKIERPKESVPAIIGTVSLNDAKRVNHFRHFEFDVLALFELLTTRAGVSEDAAENYARIALQWNSVSAELTSATQAIEAWRRCLQLSLNTIIDNGNDIGSVSVGALTRLLLGVLARLTVEDPVWLASGEALSSMALALIATISDAEPRALTGLGITDATVTAIVGHRSPTARINLYASLSKTLMACDRRVGDSGISAVLAQNGRVVSEICNDAIYGSLALRSMAITLLESLLSLEPSMPSVVTIADQSGLVQACLTALQQRDDAVVAAIHSTRTQANEVIAQWIATVRFLRLVALQSEGRALLLQRGALSAIEGSEAWQVRLDTTDTDASPLAKLRLTALLQSTLEFILSLLSSAPFVSLDGPLVPFVVRHAQLLARVLKNRAALEDADGLHAIKTATAIVQHVAVRSAHSRLPTMFTAWQPQQTALVPAQPAGNGANDIASSNGSVASKVAGWLGWRTKSPAGDAYPTADDRSRALAVVPATTTAVVAAPQPDSRIAEFLDRMAPLLVRLVVRFASPMQEPWLLALAQSSDSSPVELTDRCLVSALSALYHHSINASAAVSALIGSQFDTTAADSLQLGHLVSIVERALEQAQSAVSLSLIELSLLLFEQQLTARVLDDARCQRATGSLCQLLDTSAVSQNKAGALIAAITRRVRARLT